MKIIEDYVVRETMFYEEIMEILFSEERKLIDEDDFDVNDEWSFLEQNPEDTKEVAEYEEEIDELPTHSWRIKRNFYVCKVPEDIISQLSARKSDENTYILFSIAWDDNWGCFTRDIHLAVECESHDTAKEGLMRAFALERIDNAGSESYSKFLKKYLV